MEPKRIASGADSVVGGDALCLLCFVSEKSGVPMEFHAGAKDKGQKASIKAPFLSPRG